MLFDVKCVLVLAFLVCCVMYVVRLLFVFGWLMFDVCSMLFAVRCGLLIVGCCSMFVVDCLSCVVCYFVAVCCLLFVLRCS